MPTRILFAFAAIFLWHGPLAGIAETAGKPRARDLGIPFSGRPALHNAITDVPGVLVGHTTLIEGEGVLRIGLGPVRTGVTAILPAGPNYQPVFAGTAVLNGNGEMTGTDWIEESGLLEEPILLCNTHSAGRDYDAVIAWRRERRVHSRESEHGWAALPVVAETWDGRLHDIHGEHVRREHVFAALDGAVSGPVPEGNVGGGTGMVCHRFKGGIGTASRLLDDGHVLGVLVQANYGTRETLTIAGVPVGSQLTDLQPVLHSLEPLGDGNSILVIIGTNAPLLPHQLRRLARRGSLGVAKVGGYGSHSSGDFFLAFSTGQGEMPLDDAERTVRMLPNERIDPYLEATVQATEEAIVNALVPAETMTGINGNTVYALPHDRLRRILKRYRRLEED